jgi:hypothetical protein
MILDACRCADDHVTLSESRLGQPQVGDSREPARHDRDPDLYTEHSLPGLPAIRSGYGAAVEILARANGEGALTLAHVSDVLDSTVGRSTASDAQPLGSRKSRREWAR